MSRNLILNFHAVNNPKWFENVILLLQSKYTFVKLNFFESSNDYNNKNSFCHLTFDDGDKTFYNVVYPILLKYNIPASIFVSPLIIIQKKNFWFQEVRDYDKNMMRYILAGYLSLSRTSVDKIDFMNILKCLTISQINEVIAVYQKETNTQPKPFTNMILTEIIEVAKSGLVTVGAHTLNHPILKNESDKICFEEITGSILNLQNLLQHQVKYFAYPNGIPNIDFGKREIDVLNKNKIEIALSTESKYVDKNNIKLALPRMGLSHGSMAFVQLKLKLGSKWEKLKSFSANTEIKDRRKVALLITKINSINQNHRL